MVPGVRLARPRPRRGDDRARRRGPLRGARPDRRHRRVRPARARRAPRLLAAADDRPADHRRRRAPPGWTLAFVRSEPIRFANVVGRDVGDGASPVTLSDYINTQFDPALSWDDVDWLRSVWDGPIVAQGHPDRRGRGARRRARRRRHRLSNHGGRQLDGAPGAFSLVAPVADAVGGRIEIICDGGVRRGSDIVKAVAAGATAAMAGRAYLYALGAAGERGVDRVLEWFAADIARTMSLLGAGTIADLDRSLLDLPLPIQVETDHLAQGDTTSRHEREPDMPVAELDGIEIAYELVGEGQPWVLTPGGRFTKEVGGLPEMARALADRGRQVLTWDRPNCGASSVVFRGRSESEVQAEALGALLRHLDLGPTVIAGGSGGARVSLLAAARNPDVTAGLAMWWISGGVPGLLQLANYYCMPSADAAWHGGMEAVVELDQWQEVLASNPGNRDRFLSMDRQEFLDGDGPLDAGLLPVRRLARPRARRRGHGPPRGPDPRVPQRRVGHVAHPRDLRGPGRRPAGRRAGRATVGRRRVERAPSRGRAGRLALRSLAAARPAARRVGRPDDRRRSMIELVRSWP